MSTCYCQFHLWLKLPERKQISCYSLQPQFWVPQGGDVNGGQHICSHTRGPHWTGQISWKKRIFSSLRIAQAHNFHIAFSQSIAVSSVRILWSYHIILLKFAKTLSDTAPIQYLATHLSCPNLDKWLAVAVLSESTYSWNCLAYGYTFDINSPNIIH